MIKIAKRKLNQTERRVSKTNLVRIEQIAEWLEYKVEVVKRDLKYGIDLKSKALKREQKVVLARLESELELEQEKIRVIEKQLKEGV